MFLFFHPSPPASTYIMELLRGARAGVFRILFGIIFIGDRAGEMERGEVLSFVRHIRDMMEHKAEKRRISRRSKKAIIGVGSAREYI